MTERQRERRLWINTLVDLNSRGGAAQGMTAVGADHKSGFDDLAAIQPDRDCVCP